MRDWIGKRERHLSSAALLAGFVIDTLTLRRVDLPLENIVFGIYFCVSVVSIIVLNIVDARKLSSAFFQRLCVILPLAIQFSFGALFSGFTIFYFRSGSLATSWPFIVILIALLLGNEFVRRHYVRLVFQVSTFFVALFFFMIFFVPVFVARMGPWIFVLSGVTSLALMAIFLGILFYSVPERMRRSGKNIASAIGIIYLCITAMYFLNLIPPIPLSLKSSGVYHDIRMEAGHSIVLAESRSRFHWLALFEDVHLVESDPLFIYSAVYSPKNITIGIVHHWRYFDESIDRWVTADKIPYTIVGGNERGHRGYSVKRNLHPGQWEVDVETSHGQVIGRILFEINYVTTTPTLIEKSL
jgi:hypothetical protein